MTESGRGMFICTPDPQKGSDNKGWQLDSCYQKVYFMDFYAPFIFLFNGERGFNQYRRLKRIFPFFK